MTIALAKGCGRGLAILAARAMGIVPGAVREQRRRIGERIAAVCMFRQKIQKTQMIQTRRRHVMNAGRGLTAKNTAPMAELVQILAVIARRAAAPSPAALGRVAALRRAA